MRVQSLRAVFFCFVCFDGRVYGRLHGSVCLSIIERSFPATELYVATAASERA